MLPTRFEYLATMPSKAVMSPCWLRVMSAPSWRDAPARAAGESPADAFGRAFCMRGSFMQVPVYNRRRKGTAPFNESAVSKGAQPLIRTPVVEPKILWPRIWNSKRNRHGDNGMAHGA